MNTDCAINDDLVEACRIINEVDVINIVSLLTEAQVSYFEMYLARRREESEEELH